MVQKDLEHFAKRTRTVLHRLHTKTAIFFLLSSIGKYRAGELKDKAPDHQIFIAPKKGKNQKFYHTGDKVNRFQGAFSFSFLFDRSRIQKAS